MPITIKDISKATGKSYPTVSRALNHDPRISVATRTLIEDAATRLGYTRNKAARLLKDGKTGIIGVCTPSPCGYFYAEFAASIHKAVKRHGYSPIFAFWSNDSEQAVATASVLDWNPEGIITIEPKQIPDTCQIPVISYGNADSRFDSLIIDHDAEMRQVVEKLHELHHHDIAWLGNHADRRIQSLKHYAEQYHMTCETVSSEKNSKFLVCEQAEQLFDALVQQRDNAQLPTAIVTIHDMAAAAIIARMPNYGLKCPDDISVIGSDNLQLASHFVPTITTFTRGNNDQIAEALVSRLLFRIDHPTLAPQGDLLPAELLIRDSIAQAKH